MISVFRYNNYRKYLADIYKSRKREGKFSYRQFAELLKFRERKTLYAVITGYRNLTRPWTWQVSRALNHDFYETDYFETLVSLNQASTAEDKKYLQDKLNRIKRSRKSASQIHLIRKEQYKLYSEWYHWAVRAIIDMSEFKDDYHWLAGMVNPPITPEQARKSVALLQKSGMIRKDNLTGVYKVPHKLLSTGKTPLIPNLRAFHLDCLKLAERAVVKMPLDERNIMGLTLGISRKTYERMCDETGEFQKRMLKMAKNDDKPNRVYRFNFQLFPMSKTYE
jgi:uncharacterized protein (TIGR02147 family)